MNEEKKKPVSPLTPEIEEKMRESARRVAEWYAADPKKKLKGQVRRQ